MAAACTSANGDDTVAAPTSPPPASPAAIAAQPAALPALAEQGREIFRHDTFGDEAFWGDTLQIHKAIAGEKNGGIGPGVSPKTALAVGLKVDMDALPAEVVDAVKAGKVDLDDPATTLTLLKLKAVGGVSGCFGDDGS